MANKPKVDVSASSPDPRRWIALATLLLAGFMNLMDVTIVNVALPSLQRDLGATTSQLEWIVAGFVLAFALGLLPFGRLGDIRGKKTIFLIGVALFSLMSALCGLAPNIETLVFARVLQGVAGAIMMPQVLAITQNTFPPEERGTAFAMFGVIVSLAAVSGPVLGGALVSLDLFGWGWRPIFLINIPIGAFAIWMGIRNIPVSKGNPSISNDWVGIAIATASLFCVVFPLIEGRSLDWPLWIFVMLALSIPGIFVFVRWQMRQELRNGPQLLPIGLLKNRNYMVGTLVTTLFFAGIPGLFMILALLLQDGFALTPLQSGVATIPFPIGIFIASAISSRIGSKFTRQRLSLGLLTVLVGMFLTRQTILGLTPPIDELVFIVPLFISGIGMGFAISVLFQLVLADVPREHAGSGSGALQAFQQIGGAIGVAVIGQVFFASLSMDAGEKSANYAGAAGSAMLFNVVAMTFVLALSFTLKKTAPIQAPIAAPEA